MKTLRVPLFSTALTVLSFCILSCSNIETTNVHTAAIAGSDKQNTFAESDLKFLFEIYAFNLYRAQLAKEAQIRSTSPQTAELGGKLVEESNAINSKIADIVSKQQATLPADITEEQKEAWKQMIRQKRWAFDETFLNVINDCQQKEMEILQKGLAQVKDLNIKSLAGISIRNLTEEKDLIAGLQPLVKEKLAVAPPEPTKKKQAR